MTTNRPRHLVRRNGPELDALAITPRQIERWTHEGRISRIQPSGPTGPALVDLDEVYDLLTAGTTTATTGPLVDAPRRLLEAVDALADRYRADSRPGTAIHRLLCAIAETAEAPLWE